jgi:hypothetical protein
MLVRSVTRVGQPRWYLQVPRRTLFSLPDLSSLSPFGAQPDTQKYHERKNLPCVGGHLLGLNPDCLSTCPPSITLQIFSEAVV